MNDDEFAIRASKASMLDAMTRLCETPKNPFFSQKRAFLRRDGSASKFGASIPIWVATKIQVVTVVSLIELHIQSVTPLQAFKPLSPTFSWAALGSLSDSPIYATSIPSH